MQIFVWDQTNNKQQNEAKANCVNGSNEKEKNQKKTRNAIKTIK